MDVLVIFVVASIITSSTGSRLPGGADSRRFIADGFHLGSGDLDHIPDILKSIECKLCKCAHDCHADQYDLKESDVCDGLWDTISCSDCSSHPCKNGATCSVSNNLYKCTCTDKWTGQHCETAVASGHTNTPDHCGSSPCKHHSTCSNDQNSYICHCHKGWTGTNCETSLNDHCSSTPCTNGGTCKNANSGYTCSCPSGWSGTNCEIQLKQNSCASLNCIHGNCSVSMGVASCTCGQGWKGNECQTDINECTQHPCQNSGYCTNSMGTYSCSCTSGWEGNVCELDTDECLNNPCPTTNATCINSVGSYTCKCPSGWEGSHCNTDIDECVKYQFCQNGATCVNTPGQFSCSCTSGWTGTQCQTDIDECSNNPCKHGTCADKQGSYTCTCLPGWLGANCDTALNSTECNHICALESAVKQTPVSYSTSACSSSSTFSPDDALLQSCCYLGDKTTWIQGEQVMQKCSTDTISSYTPVAAFRNGAIVPDTAGVFTGCLHNTRTGFMMIQQDCTTNPSLYYMNGTDYGHFESDPQKYFIIIKV